MCELLGLTYNGTIQPSLSFKGFQREGEENPDGWGLAFYPDKSVQIIKEPLKADRSFLYKFIENYPRIKSRIFIAHVRQETGSAISHKNTHPFQRELNGVDFAFAHNGALKNYTKLNTSNFKPVGNSDSEYAFCHLLNLIKEENIKKWNEKSFEWLYKQIRDINQLGYFNCLLSNGEYLFSYYDVNQHKSLYYIQHNTINNNSHLSDPDYKINLELKEEKDYRGYIIATKPLTDAIWKKSKPGELIVFKEGNIVFETHIGRYSDL